MKHPTIRVVCYTNLVVFSTGFPPATGFLSCFFHPGFLEALPTALAFLLPSDLGLCVVEGHHPSCSPPGSLLQPWQQGDHELLASEVLSEPSLQT